ncbi:MAG: MerR family transcriptional regulator [Gammaproteobacteria bacterium]|nr:MerR family transcriptional regulator [Gammaproteobacteria bacterium]
MSEADSISADLLDESLEFSLAELCRICAIEESLVVAIVEEGIVEPDGESRSCWRFSGIAVTRVQRVIKLQQEFAVNLAGAALALELFEEIERLKRLQQR